MFMVRARVCVSRGLYDDSLSAKVSAMSSNNYRLYEGKIPTIARELVDVLLQKEALEVEPADVKEVELDAEAVLREYLRMDRELMNEAKAIVDRRGMPYGEAFKQKRRLAKQKQFQLGEESIDYIAHQLIEAFYHTNYVEEVFEDDNGLRRLIAPVLKRHMIGVEEQLESKVRSQLKNIQEGSAAWDVEYERAMGNLKRKQNLE